MRDTPVAPIPTRRREFGAGPGTRAGVRPGEPRIRSEIGALLDARAPGKTICPSDVARSLRDEGWRELMEPVREAARAMAADGELEVTQRGEPVDPAAARGAIRYRRP